MADIAAAILAGGKSSRMGKDKAGLQLGANTLLGHMQQVLKSANIEKIYISHPNHIADEIKAHGPLSGIHAVLNRVAEHHKHIIFVPVDMPSITSSLIRKLVHAPDEAPLAQFASHHMPFRINTDKQWAKRAETQLQTGDDLSLKIFQQQFPNPFLIAVAPEEQHCFDNINTPEDWNAFAQKVSA